MCSHPRVLGCLILTAVAITLPVPAARPADAPKRSPLAEVAALEMPVSYTETKIPVGELLQKIAADTGVSLTARPEVADEPVALAVKEMPARELLEELAVFLDYTWFRKQQSDSEKPADAFALRQDVAAKQREEALRQAGPVAAWRNLRAEIDRLAAMARLPQAQIEAIRDAGQRRLDEGYRQPREQRVAVTSTPEWMKLSQDVRAARAVAAPIPRVVAGLLGQLSAEQWTVLRHHRRLVLSSHPEEGALPLPEEAARLLRAAPPAPAPPGHIIIGGGPDAEAQFRAAEKARHASWVAASGYRVQLLLDASSADSWGAMHLRAEVTPLSDNDAAQPFAPGPPAGLHVSGSAEDFDERQMETTPARLAGWAKDPIFGRTERFQPQAKPEPDRHGPGSGGYWHLRNLLPDLGRVYGAQFIAHAYWSTGTTHGVQFPAEPAPLSRILSLVGHAYRWDRRGDLVRLHSRIWFLERPREVPLRLVRRWAAIAGQYGALPLEEYVTMATALTDLQFLGTGDLASRGVLPRSLDDLSGAYEARHALRLYATLTPAQRDALWAGRPLSLEQTSGLQRLRFLAALQAIASEGDTHQEPGERPAPWSEPQFSVSRVRQTRLGDNGQGMVFYEGQREQGPPPPPVGAAAPGKAATRPGSRRSPLGDVQVTDRPAYTQAQFDFADAGQPRHRSSVTVAVSQ